MGPCHQHHIPCTPSPSQWVLTPSLCPWRWPHLCTLLDISMGRPMLRVSRSKWGSKYSSGVMAVGLVGLAACSTGAWGGTGTAQPWNEDPSTWGCPQGPPQPGHLPHCGCCAAARCPGRSGRGSWSLDGEKGGVKHGQGAQHPMAAPAAVGLTPNGVLCRGCHTPWVIPSISHLMGDTLHPW